MSCHRYGVWKKIKTDAVGWYLKSAQGGCVFAQVAVGNLYEDGEIVPQNFSEAANGINLPQNKVI